MSPYDVHAGTNCCSFHIYHSKFAKDHFFNVIWFDFSFTALQHILGHFGRGQLP